MSVRLSVSRRRTVRTKVNYLRGKWQWELSVNCVATSQFELISNTFNKHVTQTTKRHTTLIRKLSCKPKLPMFLRQLRQPLLPGLVWLVKLPPFRGCCDMWAYWQYVATDMLTYWQYVTTDMWTYWQYVTTDMWVYCECVTTDVDILTVHHNRYVDILTIRHNRYVDTLTVRHNRPNLLPSPTKAKCPTTEECRSNYISRNMH
jgi:hypothetical protein